MQNNSRISCHAQRDANGMAPVLRTDASGRALTQFCIRATGSLKEKLRARGESVSRTIWILGWDAAQVERAKIVDEWNRAPRAEDVVHTMNELCDQFIAIRAHPDSTTRKSTVNTYRERLAQFVRPYFGTRDVRSITPADTGKWKAKYAATGAARTRQSKLGTLTALFTLARSYGWIATSPILREHQIPVLKIGQRRGAVCGDERIARALAPEEIERIVAELDEDDPALRLMVQMMGWTAWRSREAIHIRTSDVRLSDDGSAFISVVSGVPCPCGECAKNDGIRFTKNSKSRLTLVHPSLVQKLTDFMTQHREYFAARMPTPWLFPTWRRRGSSHASIGGIRVGQGLRIAFQAAAKRAGFSGLILHDLRSSAKTSLLLNGGNPTAIDAMVGHAMRGSAMNEIYARFEERPSAYYAACFPQWSPKLTLVQDQPGPVMADTRMVASR
jgi:integrase